MSDAPRLGPTTVRDLAVAAVAGLLLGFLGIWALGVLDQVQPITPWSLPGMLLTLAAAAAYYAHTLARRVREQRGSISPEEGVRAVVMGKVMLVGGAILLGMHVAYVLDNLPRFAVPSPQQRVIRGLVTVAASAVFVLAGRLLERACITDAGDDDDDDEDDGRDHPGHLHRARDAEAPRPW